jgi:predicted nucleotidyltransferase
MRGLLIEAARTAMRSASRVDAARAALQTTYLRVADAAAQAFVRLEGVTGVYLSGSVTTPSSIEPGWSDIDLVLITDLPDTEAELAFRRRLRPAFRALSSTIPALAGLDYVDVRDLDLLRTSPNAWSLGFDHRWKHLAGDVLHDASTALPPLRQRQLIGLRRALRRWCKAAPQIMTADDPARRARLARRLRADVVAYVVDASRHAPWSVLHDRASSRGIVLPREDMPDACLVATLTALVAGAAALEATDGPPHPWRVAGEVPPPTAQEARFLAAAELSGEAGLASRDPETMRRLPICFIDESPAELLTLGRRLVNASGPALPRLGPALLPAALRPVAWLLDAPGVAASSLVLMGVDVPPPTAADVALVRRGWVAECMTRARGRMLRRYGPSARQREAWREVCAGQACAAYGRGEALRFRRPSRAPSERDMVAAWRALGGAVGPSRTS